MGRIDHTYLAADGPAMALQVHWLLLPAITIAAIIAYVVASARTGRARPPGDAGRD